MCHYEVRIGSPWKVVTASRDDRFCRDLFAVPRAARHLEVEFHRSKSSPLVIPIVLPPQSCLLFHKQSKTHLLFRILPLLLRAVTILVRSRLFHRYFQRRFSRTILFRAHTLNTRHDLSLGSYVYTGNEPDPLLLSPFHC